MFCNNPRTPTMLRTKCTNVCGLSGRENCALLVAPLRFGRSPPAILGCVPFRVVNAIYRGVGGPSPHVVQKSGERHLPLFTDGNPFCAVRGVHGSRGVITPVQHVAPTTVRGGAVPAMSQRVSKRHLPCETPARAGAALRQTVCSYRGYVAAVAETPPKVVRPLFPRAFSYCHATKTHSAKQKFSRHVRTVTCTRTSAYIACRADAFSVRSAY